MTRQVVVFDLDHTLLSCNSSFCFGLFLFRKGFFSFITLCCSLFDYMRHVCFGMSINRLHCKSFQRIFFGKSSRDLHALLIEFLEKSLSSMIYLPMLERVWAAQERGDVLVLLSSSPDFLVNEIAKFLKIEKVGATTYECDSNGRFIRLKEIMVGEAKATFVKDLVEHLGVPMSKMIAYSDSDLDLPLLQIAGKAVGVVPNRKLRRICRKWNWEIVP